MRKSKRRWMMAKVKEEVKGHEGPEEELIIHAEESAAEAGISTAGIHASDKLLPARAS